MISFEKTIKTPLQGTKGFTLIEVIVVGVMISLLSAIAISNYIPLRQKALDATALADARNLITSITDAILADQDIDYTFIAPGGVIGSRDTANNPREPIYMLSPGVSAVITDASAGTFTIVSALVYHTQGTSDITTGTGIVEFSCLIDESTGTASMP